MSGSPQELELNYKPMKVMKFQHGGINQGGKVMSEDMVYFIKKEHKGEQEVCNQNFFDSIFASRILNLAFPGDKQRFPIITLGIDVSNQNNLYLVSEDLGAKGYKDIIKLDEENKNPFLDRNAIERVGKDLSYIYAAFSLIGSGDVSAANLMFSEAEQIFGEVE